MKRFQWLSLSVSLLALALWVALPGCGGSNSSGGGGGDGQQQGGQNDHGDHEGHDHGDHEGHDHDDHAHHDHEHDSEQIAANLAKLSEEDRKLAEKQKICPVSDEPLGSMGVPQKVSANGQELFICCEGCKEKLMANPDQYLAKLKK